MDPNLAALLGPDPSAFQTLIQTFLSSSNDLRAHAESLFHLLSSSHPSFLAQSLTNLLRTSANPDLRALAAVLLRKQIVNADAPLYGRIEEGVRREVREGLMEAVVKEGVRSVARKLCDTVSELAGVLLAEDEWSELVPFVFRLLESDAPNLKVYYLDESISVWMFL